MFRLCIGIYDKNLNLIGIIDKIEGLQITENLCTPSTIDLKLVFNSSIVKLLELGNYLILDNEKKERANVFIIEYKNMNLSDTGDITIEIQGRNLLSILDRRVMTKNYNMVNLNVDEAIREIISNEFINSTTERNIKNLIYIGNENLNQNINYSNSQLYISILDAVEDILNVTSLGINIYLNIITKNFEVILYKGADKTLSQNSNVPIIFSNELNNIMSENFVYTSKDYINVEYVYGTLGNNNIDELVVVNGRNYSGLDRYEGSLNNQIDNLTEENYKESFNNSGEIYIENQDLYKCFSGTFNIESNTKYGQDFVLGDFVTCFNKAWGIQEDLQITQVVQQWSYEGYSISLTFGKPLPTLSQKLKKRRK